MHKPLLLYVRGSFAHLQTLFFIYEKKDCNGNVLLNKNANSSEIIVKNVIFFCTHFKIHVKVW